MPRRSERKARKSRYKKRESDRSGFDYKEIRMVLDEGFTVGADEFDALPPSDVTLGGEGDVAEGDARADFTSTATPSEVQKVTRFIQAANGISYSEDEPYLYVAGSVATVNISANPQISRAPHERQLTLQCVSNNIILEDGNGLTMPRGLFNMDSGAIINFIYNATDSLWTETSRSHTEGGVF